MADTCDVLNYAREWISNRSHWTKGALFRDEAGEEVRHPRDAAMTCAYGACDYAYWKLHNGKYTDAAELARQAILKACRELYGYGVITVNDERGSHHDVVAAFDKAIENVCNTQ